MRTLALSLILTAAATAAEPTLQSRWRMQYFYDEDDSTFVFRDLAFSSPQRGIAVGSVSSKKDSRPKGMTVVTRDGGQTWTQVPVTELPVSVFLLNDSIGWMATDRGLWHTDESGRVWKKINNKKGILRVHFIDENRGFLTGSPKLFMETKDGGKTWSDVAVVSKIETSSDNTYFDWIEWVTPKRGVILGANIAPRRDQATWMDPEKLSQRREWPGLNITIETLDGGNTWIHQTAPVFGRFHRVRRAPANGVALFLIRFVNSFQYPSEVYVLDGQGKSTRVYREANRNVTDINYIGKSALLAAVEPVGKLHQLPIPGRVHLLWSQDLKTWNEMKVDYRAVGQSVVTAVSGTDAWVATDTGMILKLTN